MNERRGLHSFIPVDLVEIPAAKGLASLASVLAVLAVLAGLPACECETVVCPNGSEVQVCSLEPTDSCSDPTPSAQSDFSGTWDVSGNLTDVSGDGCGDSPASSLSATFTVAQDGFSVSSTELLILAGDAFDSPGISGSGALSGGQLIVSYDLIVADLDVALDEPAEGSFGTTATMSVGNDACTVTYESTATRR